MNSPAPVIMTSAMVRVHGVIGRPRFDMGSSCGWAELDESMHGALCWPSRIARFRRPRVPRRRRALPDHRHAAAFGSVLSFACLAARRHLMIDWDARATRTALPGGNDDRLLHMDDRQRLQAARDA